MSPSRSTTLLRPLRQRQRQPRFLALTFAAVATLAALAALATASSEGDEKFIGWRGETYQQSGGGAARRPWIQTISWKPRAFVYHHFLTDAECEHVKRLAAPRLRRSTVVAPNGSSVLDTYRTSYGCFINRRRDPIIAAIDARVAEWARIPEQHAEDMQVLRYGHLQTYKPHMDSLVDDEAGARVATVLLYLSDVEEGGETAFPDSTHWAHPDLAARGGPFSACTDGGVAYKPRKGDALLFWSIKPDGKTEDAASMHTGCPVLKGVKWTATKWIHSKPFRAESFGAPEHLDPDPGLCEDADSHCQEWAEAGQCEGNPGFMVGRASTPGRCRRACGACAPCAAAGGGGGGLRACYNERRRAAGYLEATEEEAYLFPALSPGGARDLRYLLHRFGGGVVFWGVLCLLFVLW